jgi:hypothetical protein
MDDPIDAAGACPATYTKNTTTRNGELLFMMMPLYLNSILETFQATSWITILKKRISESV